MNNLLGKKTTIQLVLIVIPFILNLSCFNKIGSVEFFITNMVISITATYQLFKMSKIEYGFNIMFYIYIYFFIGIAPILQLKEKVVFWTSTPFHVNDYVLTNLIVILSLLVYQISYNKALKTNINQGRNMIARNILLRKYPRESILLLVSIICTLLYFYFNNWSLINVLIRGGDSDVSIAVEYSSTMQFLFITKLLRPFPASCFILFKIYRCKNRFVEILLLLLMLLSNSPTGMPRFAAAAFYVPVMFLYIRWLSARFNFQLLVIAGLMVIFPFLNLFRTLDYNLKNIFSLNLFTSPHFDSYQMFMRVVQEDIVTYGKQLLGVIFFWIPRSIWPDKAVGSGYYVADKLNYHFDNISMSYFGEGYINFGIIGVIFFLWILGVINGYADKNYWFSTKKSNLFIACYLISMGMLFATLRGALLNIYPVAVGYVLGVFIVDFCSRYKKIRFKMS